MKQYWQAQLQPDGIKAHCNTTTKPYLSKSTSIKGRKGVVDVCDYYLLRIPTALNSHNFSFFFTPHIDHDARPTNNTIGTNTNPHICH